MQYNANKQIKVQSFYFFYFGNFITIARQKLGSNLISLMKPRYLILSHLQSYKPYLSRYHSSNMPFNKLTERVATKCYKFNHLSILACLLSAERCNQKKQIGISSDYP